MRVSSSIHSHSDRLSAVAPYDGNGSSTTPIDGNRCCFCSRGCRRIMVLWRRWWDGRLRLCTAHAGIMGRAHILSSYERRLLYAGVGVDYGAMGMHGESQPGRSVVYGAYSRHVLLVRFSGQRQQCGALCAVSRETETQKRNYHSTVRCSYDYTIVIRLINSAMGMHEESQPARSVMCGAYSSTRHVLVRFSGQIQQGGALCDVSREKPKHRNATTIRLIIAVRLI